MATLNLCIIASSDDAEENNAPAVPNLTSDDLDFYGGSSRMVGLRFQAVTIPAGATINSATVILTANANKSNCHDQTIYCQAIDDAPTFTTDSGNISSRALTSGVSWVVGDTTADAEKTTADFAAALQEVIDRDGWASGQDIVIIFKGAQSNTTQAAFHSFNHGSNVPELHVDYTTEGGGGGGTGGYAWGVSLDGYENYITNQSWRDFDNVEIEIDLEETCSLVCTATCTGWAISNADWRIVAIRISLDDGSEYSMAGNGGVRFSEDTAEGILTLAATYTFTGVTPGEHTITLQKWCDRGVWNETRFWKPQMTVIAVPE